MGRCSSAILLCVLGLVSLRASSLYSVSNSWALGASAAQPTGLNAGNLAVGFITDAQGDQVPAYFSGAQTGLLSGVGQANGVNDLGEIVGTTYQNNSPFVSYWSNGQLVTTAISGYGTAVNNSGQLAGGDLNGSGQLRAFVSTNGVISDLGTLGGTWSSAYALDSAGQIAGTSTTTTGAFHAFFYSSGGMVDLGTLGGTNSYGLAINSSGSVAGNASVSTGYSHAFEWNGSLMADLGTLGGNQSYAYGIDASGNVVGYSWTTGNLATHAFLYRNGIMLDLNSLLSPIDSGWTLTAAYAINGTGDILATGVLDSQDYAVELNPAGTQRSRFVSASIPINTPEPVALCAAGLAFLVIAWRFLGCGTRNNA